MPIYMPGSPPPDAGEQIPTVLAIGDSWFWYPKNNLLNALIANKNVNDRFKSIQLLGYNGAKLFEYVDRNNINGRYAKEFQYQINPQNAPYYSTVLISGGGNDAVDYRLGLKADCSKYTAPEDCLSTDGLAGLLGEMTGALDIMLYEIAKASSAMSRPLDVFIHGYDYVVPDGRAFDLAGLRLTGPWLKPALDQAKVPNDMALRKAICRALIDAVNVAFAKYDSHQSAVHYINSRGTLNSDDAVYRDDWDNELHPTRSGFDAIVEKCWIPILAREGYAHLPQP